MLIGRNYAKGLEGSHVVEHVDSITHQVNPICLLRRSEFDPPPCRLALITPDLASKIRAKVIVSGVLNITMLIPFAKYLQQYLAGERLGEQRIEDCV